LVLYTVSRQQQKYIAIFASYKEKICISVSARVNE